MRFEDGHWRPVRLLLESMSAQIAELYAERGAVGVPPRFSMVLIRLGTDNRSTITELATTLEVTHSAMSQTVAAMAKEGLVQTVPGKDARTRVVTLTEQGRDLVPFLEAEWRATEAAVIELDREVGGGLRQAVQDITRALEDRPFADRLRHHLDACLHDGDIHPGRGDAGGGRRERVEEAGARLEQADDGDEQSQQHGGTRRGPGVRR